MSTQKSTLSTSICPKPTESRRGAPPPEEDSMPLCHLRCNEYVTFTMNMVTSNGQAPTINLPFHSHSSLALWHSLYLNSLYTTWCFMSPLHMPYSYSHSCTYWITKLHVYMYFSLISFAGFLSCLHTCVLAHFLQLVVLDFADQALWLHCFATS